MNREVHVRICERLGVKFPGPTRHVWTVPAVQENLTIISEASAFGEHRSYPIPLISSGVRSGVRPPA